MFEFFNDALGYFQAFWSWTVDSMEMAWSSLVYMLGAVQIGNAIAPYLPNIIGTAVVAMTSIMMIKSLTSML